MSTTEMPELHWSPTWGGVLITVTIGTETFYDGGDNERLLAELPADAVRLVAAPKPRRWLCQNYPAAGVIGDHPGFRPCPKCVEVTG